MSTDTANTPALESELSAARISCKRFVIKPSRIRTSSKDSQIGWGGYATVYRATLRKRWWWTRKPVAIKSFSVSGNREERLRVALVLVRELKIWAPLMHPNILALHGFYISKDLDEMWLISDLATNGNLFTYLETGDHPLDERLSLAKDTAEGLNYLHTRTPPICHGDIKSLNILIGANMRALICDFGMASEDEPVTLNGDTDTLHVGGTTRYSSPEVFGEESRPTIASDVWSWGCLFHEIVTGLGPYNDVVMEAQVIHRISVRVPPAVLDRMDGPDYARELLKRCWGFDPMLRPTMSQCLDVLRGASIQTYRRRQRQSSGQNTDANLNRLEAELNEVLAPLEDLRIEPSTIVFPPSGGIAGEGGYGVVFQAAMARQGQREQVAVKKLRANGGRGRRLQMVIAVIQKLKASARLDHPNILPFIGFYLTPSMNEAWLISPFMPNGDISVFLRQSVLVQETRMSLALDTARGLEYLHSVSICHSDIKSSNVLIRSDRRAVLCDFGLAKSMESMPTGLTTTTFNQGGTLSYESPELILGNSTRSFHSDIWAWGCLLHEILTGKPPYHWANNAGAIVKWITMDIPPAILVEGVFQSHIRQLLVLCWQSDVSMRPTIKQCISALSGDVSELAATSKMLKKRMTVRLPRGELDFKKTAIVGLGIHGTVYNGTVKKQGSSAVVQVAVKGLCLTKSQEGCEAFSRIIEDNAANWTGLRHQNILPFLGFSIDPLGDPDVLLASSFIPNGNLSDYLKRSSLSYKRKVELAKGILDGLLYLHTRDPPVYHGNLHPRNVLVTDKGAAVLTDYGIAGMMDRTKFKFESPGDVEVSSRYWSLDVNAGAERSVQDDVWSWGCVLLEVMTGRVPYDGVEDIPAVVDDLDCPPRIQNLLGLCWKRSRMLRPNISEITAILDGESFRFGNTYSIPFNQFTWGLCFTVTRDGTKLAIGWPNRVEIHDINERKRLPDLPMSDAYGEPTCLEYSRSGKYLVAGNSEGRIVVWDVETGRISRAISVPQTGVVNVEVSWDDTLVASVLLSSDIHLDYLADVKNGRRFVPVKPARLVTFSPKSDVVAVGLVGGGVQIFGVDTGESLALVAGSETPNSLSFSPDGRWLLEGGLAGLRKWDTRGLTNNTPQVIYRDQRIYAASISSDDDDILVFTDSLRGVYVRMNCFHVPAVNRKVGSMPSDPSLVGIFGSVIVSLDSWLSSDRRLRVLKVASYDSPGTYRIDPMPDESDDGPSC